MEKYFELQSDNSSKEFVYAPEEQLYESYKMLTHFEQLPFKLEIKEGIFKDYVSNDLGWPLMSLELKKIFENYQKRASAYKWIKVDILHQQQKITKEYFFGVAINKLDVLNYTKTKMVHGDFEHGIFSYKKIKGFSFFPHPSIYNNNIIVIESLKYEILGKSITGVHFEEIEVSDNDFYLVH